MLSVYAVAVTIAAVTCAAGWLGCHRALREERGWSAHYLAALMRREQAQRRSATADAAERWLREVGR